MAVQFHLLPCPVSFPHDAEVLIVTYDFSWYNAFGQIIRQYRNQSPLEVLVNPHSNDLLSFICFSIARCSLSVKTLILVSHLYGICSLISSKLFLSPSTLLRRIPSLIQISSYSCQKFWPWLKCCRWHSSWIIVVMASPGSLISRLLYPMRGVILLLQ